MSINMSIDPKNYDFCDTNSNCLVHSYLDPHDKSNKRLNINKKSNEYCCFCGSISLLYQNDETGICYGCYEYLEVQEMVMKCEQCADFYHNVCKYCKREPPKNSMFQYPGTFLLTCEQCFKHKFYQEYQITVEKKLIGQVCSFCNNFFKNQKISFKCENHFWCMQCIYNFQTDSKTLLTKFIECASCCTFLKGRAYIDVCRFCGERVNDNNKFPIPTCPDQHYFCKSCFSLNLKSYYKISCIYCNYFFDNSNTINGCFICKKIKPMFFKLNKDYEICQDCYEYLKVSENQEYYLENIPKEIIPKVLNNFKESLNFKQRQVQCYFDYTQKILIYDDYFRRQVCYSCKTMKDCIEICKQHSSCSMCLRLYPNNITCKDCKANLKETCNNCFFEYDKILGLWDCKTYHKYCECCLKNPSLVIRNLKCQPCTNHLTSKFSSVFSCEGICKSCEYDCGYFTLKKNNIICIKCLVTQDRKFLKSNISVLYQEILEETCIYCFNLILHDENKVVVEYCRLKHFYCRECFIDKKTNGWGSYFECLDCQKFFNQKLNKKTCFFCLSANKNDDVGCHKHKICSGCYNKIQNRQMHMAHFDILDCDDCWNAFSIINPEIMCKKNEIASENSCAVKNVPEITEALLEKLPQQHRESYVNAQAYYSQQALANEFFEIVSCNFCFRNINCVIQSCGHRFCPPCLKFQKINFKGCRTCPSLKKLCKKCFRIIDDPKYLIENKMCKMIHSYCLDCLLTSNQVQDTDCLDCGMTQTDYVRCIFCKKNNVQDSITCRKHKICSQCFHLFDLSRLIEYFHSFCSDCSLKVSKFAEDHQNTFVGSSKKPQKAVLEKCIVEAGPITPSKFYPSEEVFSENLVPMTQVPCTLPLNDNKTLTVATLKKRPNKLCCGEYWPLMKCSDIACITCLKRHSLNYFQIFVNHLFNNNIDWLNNNDHRLGCIKENCFNRPCFSFYLVKNEFLQVLGNYQWADLLAEKYALLFEGFEMQFYICKCGYVNGSMNLIEDCIWCLQGLR